MNQTLLTKALVRIAWECRKVGHKSDHAQSKAYEIAASSVVHLARDIRRTKPRRTRRRTTKHYGHTTLALLTEQHIGPARVSIMALQDGEHVGILKWPEDTTLEDFQRVSRSMFFTADIYYFSEPLKESLQCLGFVVDLVAQLLPAVIDYRKPEFCGICFKHTDPDSESKHCLDHLRSSRTKQSTKYKRGQRQVEIATNLIKKGEFGLSLARFYKDGRLALSTGNNAEFIHLVRQHCPRVGSYITEEIECKEEITDVIRALAGAGALDDPFMTSWLDYVDRRYRAVLPDPVFDPTRIQIIDHDYTRKGVDLLRDEWTDHICEWIARADVHYRAAEDMRGRGRPKQADSKSAEVRRLLAEGKLSKEEIVAKVDVSWRLVHRIASELKTKNPGKRSKKKVSAA